MSKILLLGARFNKFDPDDRGGVTVLFELLIEELKKRKIEFEVIDTLSANYGGKFQTLLGTWRQLLGKFWSYEQISVHATMNSFFAIAPLLVVMGKLFSKKISIRFFGGNFGDVYDSANASKKFIMRFTLKHADTIFFELKHLVKEFEKYNKNTFWFPNVRDRSIAKTVNRVYRKRFVYIGTINQEKGIDDICAIYHRLDDDIVFDIYGPIIENIYSKEKFDALDISYKGVLEPDEVMDRLNQYDILVLPSYREGYPGVIIEAFAQGMPVIATKLEGIMEMCQDGYNAKLMDVGDREGLLDAIKDIDEESYRTMHENAVDSFQQFDSHSQTELFLERIGFQYFHQRDHR